MLRHNHVRFFQDFKDLGFGEEPVVGIHEEPAVVLKTHDIRLRLLPYPIKGRGFAIPGVELGYSTALVRFAGDVEYAVRWHSALDYGFDLFLRRADRDFEIIRPSSLHGIQSSSVQVSWWP